MTLLSKGVAVAAALATSCAFVAVAGAQTAGPASPAAEDTVVAIVDDEKIFLSEILSAKEALPEQYKEAPLEAIYNSLLDQVVERRIIARAAAAEGLDRDSEVVRRMSRAREGILLEAYISKHVQPLLTDENLRKRYEQQVANQSGDEEVHARHILLESEADARAVLQEIDKGIEFTVLAKERSKGPSASRGGDLGFFRRQDMVPEFAEVAFTLGEGEVSEPVKTQFGWHVILVVAKRTAEPPSYDQMAEALQREAAREAVVGIITGLRSKSTIHYFNPDGTPLVVPNVIRPAK